MAKKININLLEFIEVFNQGKTDVELATIFNCSESYIKKYRKNLGFRPNVRRLGRAKLIDKEQLIKLVQEGKSNSEIAKFFSVTTLSVRNAKKRYELEVFDERKNTPILLTHEQKEVIFGSLLGDAYGKIQQKNAEIIILHSKKLLEYLNYLLLYFNNIPYSITEYNRKDTRTGQTYNVISLRLFANECFNEFIDMFYKDSKIIPVDFLEEYYTPLAMAIHYCDDGWNEGNAAIFATCSFTIEELNKLKKFLFNKYDLETTIFGLNRLRIRSCSFKKFVELIRPYIPENMKYKIEKVVS